MDHVFSNNMVNVSTNVSECVVTRNGSIISCNSWVYDQSQYASSLISSFDMVCDNKFLRSHMMVCHYLGLFVGSLTCAILCDTVGRRHVLTVSLVGMFLPNLIRSWVDNVPLVGFLIFANGYFSMILYATAYILATELVGPSKRVLVNFLFYLVFCVGAYVLLLFAYLIRDWRYLGWATSVPVGISLFILFFIKESPRWLIATGKMEKAKTILQDIAKDNNVNFDIDLNSFKPKEETTSISCFTCFKQFIKSKVLLVRLGILCFNWFAISMTYFGITMKVGNLGGDVYINYLVSNSAEVLGLFICLAVAERHGRRHIFSISMIICGICCLCTIFTSLYADASLHWITIGLTMIGKLSITVSYFHIYLMVSETFPTVLRSFALGTCSSSGRVGAMVSAYVGDLGVLLDTKFGVSLPLMIFGAFGLSAGVLSFFLPETSNISLPQTVEDAEKIKRKRSVNGHDISLISRQENPTASDIKKLFSENLIAKDDLNVNTNGCNDTLM